MELDWVWVVIRLLVGAVIMGFALVLAGCCTLVLRKVGARMQQRLGPNRVGPGGSVQWIADALKMVHKEAIVPAGAKRVVFWLAPSVGIFAATLAYAFIPLGESITLFGRTIPYYVGDTPVGLIGLLACSAFGVYALIMAAWASNNKYALMGGLRASAQVISYELTMGIALVGVMMLAESLNLNDIARAQGGSLLLGSGAPAHTPGVWLILLQPVGFLIYMVSAIAECNQPPFDLPEAESELVAGYHVEYSGMQFGAFQAAEFVNVITISAIATFCFLGGWQPIIPIGWAALAPLWFILKVCGLIFVVQWIRWTVPRFRYDQLMGICWKGMYPVVLLNIGLLAILRAWVPLDTPPLGQGTLEQSWPWLAFIAVQLTLAVVLVLGISRVLVRSWWGRSDRASVSQPPALGTPAFDSAGRAASSAKTAP
jgi:NADH-quinone oxidoreductase subunit H